MNAKKHISKIKSYSSDRLPTAFLLAAAIFTHGAHAEEWERSIGLSVGQIQVDESSWGKENEFGSVALNLDMKKESWPISLSLSLYGAGDENLMAETSTDDVLGGLLIGVKKHWQFTDSNIRPFISAGVSYTVAEKSFYSPEIYRKQRDKDISYFAGAGLQWRFSSSFSLGVDARYTDADVTIFNEAVDAGGLTSSLNVAYHF